MIMKCCMCLSVNNLVLSSPIVTSGGFGVYFASLCTLGNTSECVKKCLNLIRLLGRVGLGCWCGWRFHFTNGKLASFSGTNGSDVVRQK